MRVKVLGIPISFTIVCLLFITLYVCVLPAIRGVTSFSVEVRGKENKQPIQNASVTLKGHTELTNNFGLARFSNIWFDQKDETADATVTAAGYKSKSVKIDATSEGDTVKIFLEQAP
jgi:hypothetical protein